MTSNDLDQYLRLPYRMEVYRDGDYWAAEFPELPGLAAGHETWEGLQTALDDAKRAYFEAALERGLPIPLPAERQLEFSGKLVLRLSKSIHRDAARMAERDGVSLNTFIASAVARELGRCEARRSRPDAPAPHDRTREVLIASG
jgi:antitoxin HicB